MKLKLGTRASALALAQARQIAAAVDAATGDTVELIEITTAADRSAAPVAELGTGVFVSALRDALNAKDIDLAVHSYKDLPTAPADGLTIAAVPTREDPRDALVISPALAADGIGRLTDLPAGSRVGTGSPRRVAQLLALGQGLECVPLRGNVDTRLRRAGAGEIDAVVVAVAGVRRLGRSTEITEMLDPMLMLPAPAQGALAVECRAADAALAEVLGGFDDAASRAAVTAERALLAALEAGCIAPVAALATWAALPDNADAEITLHAGVFRPDGAVSLRRSATGLASDAATVGRSLADELLAAGAERLMRST